MKNRTFMWRGLISALAVVAIAGTAIAVSASSPPPSNAVSKGRGIDQFGLTSAFFEGRTSPFTYTKGFFCDTSVASFASSKCEAGKAANHAPSSQHDPLFITVPLGFDVPMNMQDCPAKLVCVDHPGTIDLTRLQSALKPLYPSLSDAQLRGALKNFMVPGHDHFITDLNNGKPEWWDVQVIGVTSASVLKDIRNHKSYDYIKSLIDAKNPSVVGPIPTNMFLFFAAK